MGKQTFIFEKCFLAKALSFLSIRRYKSPSKACSPKRSRNANCLKKFNTDNVSSSLFEFKWSDTRIDMPIK